jgi:cleavage and polyadenylation specificity factor subunit 1
MKLIAIIEGVDCLPPVLSTEPPKRSNTRETLTEFVVANLGDSSGLSPYLIVRNLCQFVVFLMSNSTILGSNRK